MQRLALGLFVLYWKVLVWTVTLSTAFFLSYSVTFLPLTGFYLLGYVSTISIATIWLCSVLLQNFLHQNKPLDFKLKAAIQCKDVVSCDTKKLTIDIDEYFIRKWFVYISNERTFNEESSVILEDALKRIINVQRSLENETIIHGCLNLYLRHLKEFRRALKRKEKYGGKIYELYCYSHMCSDSSKSKEYFLHKLTTNLLNHFINWELSNSLPYRVLVSIVSRKVVAYSLELLSNPEFLNYCILYACASPEKIQELKLQDYSRIKLNIMNFDEENIVENVEIDSPPSKPPEHQLTEIIETKEIPPPVEEPPKTDVDEVDTSIIKKTTPPKLAEIIKKSEQVKIHEPKSCKTWYDSCDLESVTLGQDILDLIEDSDHEEEEMSPLSSAKSLLDEVKHITSIEGIKTSMKPISAVTTSTFNNIKDFQESTVSTVNSVMKPMSQATSTAFHKIGGLHLQDEAAGVVEGLLDFGRTKIRKGLRLTGLQEEPHNKLPLQKRYNIQKMAHVNSGQDKNDNFESTWINPLLEDSPAKAMDSDDRIPYKIPSISTTFSHEEIGASPDPEYEDTADLATSIAKLRSLLEQKSSESSVSTPALSPMPPDEFAAKILETEDEGDGMMPSFYKFCAKTATGVLRNTLNTVKTALPGNITELDRFHAQWLFVESSSCENDLFERMDKVLNERQVFCTVDAAYEAIDSLAPLLQPPSSNLGRSNIQFEDELDDFEVKIPVTKALLDIFCELLADTEDSTLSQEPVIKTVLLIFGRFLEETILAKTNALVNYWCANAKIPAESRTKTLKLDLDHYVGAILSGLPDYFKHVANENVLTQAITMLVSSLQVQKVNEDMFMQIFEILCMKLIEGSKQLSPISA